jgi:hypothetical protein
VLFGIDDVASSRIKIPTVDMSGWSAGSAYIFWKADLDPPVANQRTGMWHLGSDAGPDISTYPYLDGVVYDTGLSTDFKTVGDLTPPLTDWHLYSIHSTANDWRAYLDGANVFTTATNTFQGPGPNNTVPQIGANQGSNVMSGHIAEFLLYDIVHDTTTRQAVEAYFSARYGTF